MTGCNQTILRSAAGNYSAGIPQPRARHRATLGDQSVRAWLREEPPAGAVLAPECPGLAAAGNPQFWVVAAAAEPSLGMRPVGKAWARAPGAHCGRGGDPSEVWAW